MAKKRDVDELLAPVFESFKAQAELAIQNAVDSIKNILVTTYSPDPAQIPKNLPAPRLQLRWENGDRFNCDWVCHYELVFPLRPLDVRSTDNGNSRFGVVTLGRTLMRGGGETPPWHYDDIRNRRPYRDGVHADWDAEMFGGWPVYVFGDDKREPALVPPNPSSVKAA